MILTKQRIWAESSRLPPKRLLTPSSVIVPSEVGDWTASAPLDISSDTDYYKATGVTAGSIKMKPNGTNTDSILYRSDLTPGDHDADTSVSLWYYVHEGTAGGVDDCQEISTLKIQFGIEAMEGYQTHELISAANPDPRVPGWHYLEITSSMWGTASGANFAWADVEVIRWYLTTTAAAKRPEITVGPVRIFPKRTKGIVCFNIDDGLVTQMPYMAYLAGLGISATLYVTPNKAGTGSYMTASQMRDVRDMGHLVANHSWNHENLSGLADAEKIVTVVKAGRWLCDEGMPEGARIFAVPGGSGQITAGLWNLLRPHLDQCRGTSYLSQEGAATAAGYTNYVGADSLYRTFNSCSDNAGSDGNSEADMIDRAIADGTIISPLRHEVWTDFKTNADTVATAVAAGTLETMTMADLLGAI